MDRLLAYWTEHYRKAAKGIDPKVVGEEHAKRQLEALEASRQARILHIGSMSDEECERELTFLANKPKDAVASAGHCQGHHCRA